MRVTAQTKVKTRSRILDRTRKLLLRNDFQQMTTRQIASSANIGIGTFFNYFPTKDALLLTLLAESLDSATLEYRARRRGSERLAEDLFLLISTGLGALRPYRANLGAAMETLLNGFTTARSDVAGQIRMRHLDEVAGIFRAHGIDPDASFVTLHLYWSLYVGVLSFWTRDTSPHQEETLVLLDRSLELLVSSLAPGAPRESEVDHDAEH